MPLTFVLHLLLAELFQWVQADEALARFSEPGRKQRASEEISDVLIYVLRLADVLKIDIAASNGEGAGLTPQVST